MHITIVTLFPEMFEGPFSHSIIKRAQDNNQITLRYVHIRDFAQDKHKSVDDKPYGGGVGMILRVDVMDKALAYAKTNITEKNTRQITILLDPRGDTYTQSLAQKFANDYDHIILVCGHYEGFDERIRSLVDTQLSIGDYILTGGEIPAMIVVDSVTRLLGGVIHENGPISESFTDGLEYPQYTRPFEYKGMKVPDTLLSGNHKQIALWKNEQSQTLTKTLRPDLLRKKTAIRK